MQIPKLLFGDLDFFTISNQVLIQNWSVVSGYSREFFEFKLCWKNFFKWIKNEKKTAYLSPHFSKMATPSSFYKQQTLEMAHF